MKRMKLKSVKPVTVKSENLPDVLTIDQLAQFLQCKRRAIYNLTRSRAQASETRLPVLRLPVGIRFLKPSVLAWMARAESQ
jgi:predicted DNA-binding transcriptional regulator AlpA